jgi:hypothetical protein
VSAWPYAEPDVGLGEEGAASTASDQPDELGIVHVFRNDLAEFTFVSHGISHIVGALPENETITLDSLRSWSSSE